MIISSEQGGSRPQKQSHSHMVSHDQLVPGHRFLSLKEPLLHLYLRLVAGALKLTGEKTALPLWDYFKSGLADYGNSD